MCGSCCTNQDTDTGIPVWVGKGAQGCAKEHQKCPTGQGKSTGVRHGLGKLCRGELQGLGKMCKNALWVRMDAPRFTRDSALVGVL